MHPIHWNWKPKVQKWINILPLRAALISVLLNALEMLLSTLWSAKMQMSFHNLSTLLSFICIKILVVLKIPIYIADSWCVYFRVLIWFRGTWSRGLPERFTRRPSSTLWLTRCHIFTSCLMSWIVCLWYTLPVNTNEPGAAS